MKIIAATHSNLPRIGEKPEQQKLRRAYADLEKGRIDKKAFVKIQDELVRELISIQESSGCEIVTDGMIRWYDHASHIASHLKGFEINGLLRFFDTNYYYRQPIAGDNIAPGNGGLADEIAFASAGTKLPLKAAILGPYTLAKMSQNRSKMNFENFCIRMAEILGVEIERLAKKGATYIQVEEPAFVREPGDFDFFRESFEALSKNKGRAKIILCFYFGDCSPLLNKLAEIPADMFGLDFTYSRGLQDRLSTDGFPKAISFGILDGRNTRMESADKAAGNLESMLSGMKIDECHVTTSCGLEFLPREYAVRKLELTGKIASLLNG